jgi:hypothetical protein
VRGDHRVHEILSATGGDASALSHRLAPRLPRRIHFSERRPARDAKGRLNHAATTVVATTCAHLPSP